jgi:hypothetical protein
MPLMLSGCLEENKTVDQQQEDQQERHLKEMSRQTGLPEIVNFQEKKIFKSILELRDQADLITYSYAKNEYSGKFVYLGKSIGFGLPAATQYTNPERVAEEEYNDPPMPQADPNGLFMPDSTAATWILLINPDTGKPEPMYFEPELTVTMFKLPKRLVDPASLPSDY